LYTTAETGSVENCISEITDTPAATQSVHSIESLLNYLVAVKKNVYGLYNNSISISSQNWLSTTVLTSFSKLKNNRVILPDILGAGADRKLLDSTLEKVDQWIYAEEEDDLLSIKLLQLLPLDEIIRGARAIESAVHTADYTTLNSLNSEYWKKQGVFIGSPGRDIYTNSSWWCILDPGGNDLYLENIGFAGMAVNKPLSIIIDLDGDDVYRSASCGGAGSAILGISLIADRSGNDIYISGAVSQGAAIGGAAILRDSSGKDYYQASQYSQGMGFFGLGALIDDAGSDTYEISNSGQGYGGVKGYGILCDSSGNDLYSSGRLQADHGRFDNRFISLSQGVGMGMRPYASGGIGALIDRKGNDVYVADVFGQGVGYWYGLGMLIDLNGQDTYQMYEYGQGAGIHLACGALLDGSGNDVYTLRNGIGQGASHDFAVGYLRDYSGNDQYQGHITVQGSSINNGVALLIDDKGNDWYSSFSHISQGFGRFEDLRDFGSLGMCLDASGDDWYHDVKRNAFIDIRGLQGICIDYPDEKKQENNE